MLAEVLVKLLVTVSEGTLKGEVLKNVLTSQEYFSFRGIPYARPPVGPLRFQNPVPPEKYDGIWDATLERSPCLQKFFYNDSLGGNEDCLYLNVYTPKLPEAGDSLKPVMFYLHGGGCMEGQKDASFFGPDYLIAKDVVLVVPNYRLHIFGFLNLGLDECPGNVGFKDQVAALKWTKTNIKKFGGDPNNILLFGESTGATSIMYLLSSPLSRGKGFFHKAIIQSGSILSNRSFVTVETCTERASRAAIKLGFGSKDPHELYNFLMKAPADELTTHALQVLTKEEKYSGETFPFVSSLETVGPINKRMIAEERADIMKLDPGIPILMGAHSQEASLLLSALISKKHPAQVFITRAEGFIIPKLFQGMIKDEETKKDVMYKVKQFYFPGTTYEDIVLGAVDLFSDMMFIRGFHDATRAMLEHSSHPLYIYMFSFPASSGPLEFFFNYTRPSFLEGSGHTDELGYLFRMVINEKEPVPTEVDRKVREHMTTIWTNFAKYSDPGRGLFVDFKPATLMDRSYLEINENLTVKTGVPFEKRMKFIDSIYAFLKSKPFCRINKKCSNFNRFIDIIHFLSC